uniref:Ubiquitin carboxyl-terminal hydrolase n=1 Tax=Pyricularia oryzae (strain P131) TaxID=1143193 RepID=L7J153_PYRO1
MPEKSLQVATYAAGASLAAITLIYVFAPTYLLDSENAGRSGSSRKRGVVGLSNPANDCFINSILQALAGLGDLRVYLIRETHRRSLDEDDDAAKNSSETTPNRNGATSSSSRSIYRVAVPHGGLPEWKILGLQGGVVTAGLKRILDQLNERPIAKKTASALPFVRDLEGAFRQRISRQQQDAQEFLQVVAERLCDEYHAGQRARRAARRREGGLEGDARAMDRRIENPAAAPTTAEAKSGGAGSEDSGAIQTITKGAQAEDDDEDEEGFPMEGKFESQIELRKVPPRARQGRLRGGALPAAGAGHGAGGGQAPGHRAAPASHRDRPGARPEGVPLPDARYAPKRRIARHIRMTSFPKILAVHLSRSIYERSQSQKNSAKVAFPERLPLGGLLHRRKYKLLGVVAHKGSHHSGHYESFRRQNLYAPFSTPNAFAGAGVYGKGAGAGTAGSVAATPATRTPRLGPLQKGDGASTSSPAVSTPDLSLSGGTGAGTPATTPSNSSADDAGGGGSPTTPARPSSSTSRLASLSLSPRRDKDKDKDTDSSSLRSVARSTLSRMAGSSSRSGSKRRGTVGEDQQQQQQPNGGGTSKPATASSSSPLAKTSSRRKKAKNQDNMWWRLSDEKVKEATTKDVLGMQREVYLLFYEMEKEDE